MAKEKFTIEVIDDSEDTMRNYLGYIKDEDDEVIVSVNMYWDELSGEDEDFDEDDEDSGELPHFDYEIASNIYENNKEFFDKFAEDKGLELEGFDDDELVIFSGELDVSPTMRTVKILTKELLKIIEEVGINQFDDDSDEDDEEYIDEWVKSRDRLKKNLKNSSVSDCKKGLRENLNRPKPKAQSTKKYMDDDTSLVDLVSGD